MDEEMEKLKKELNVTCPCCKFKFGLEPIKVLRSLDFLISAIDFGWEFMNKEKKKRGS